MRRDRPRIDVLGELQIASGAVELGARDLGGRKPKQLLEVLLVHPDQPVPKDRIADLLWGARQPRDPARALEAYVSGLRGRLAPVVGDPRRVLRSEPLAYRLVLDEVDLDLRRFDELTARAVAAEDLTDRLAMRRQALAMVRGELLADEPHAEWVLPLRGLYTERWLGMLLDAADDCLAADLTVEAVENAETVLRVQPARERAYRVLITAHYAAGEQDLALRAYERCRRVLDDEFGVRPLADTERAFLSVLRHEPVDALVPRVHPVVAAPRTPRTRFARNGDATIAYQVIGDGPLDVVFSHAWFSHMEVGWEEPRYAGFLRRLAAGRRLLLFDRRGMGMSDPAPPTVGLVERTDDIRAVMDAAGSAQAVVFGSCGSGPLAISLAVRHPDRVAGLVLFGSYPRLLAAPDYPAGWTDEFFEQYKAGLELGWTTGRGIARSVPTVGQDEALMEWFGRLLRLSASPATARAVLDFAATVDVRTLLSGITAPTIVLHRLADRWVHPDNGRHLAAHIPGARLVDLEGADHWPWFGDAQSVLAPVEEFLGEVARTAPRTRSRGFFEGRRGTLVP